MDTIDAAAATEYRIARNRMLNDMFTPGNAHPERQRHNPLRTGDSRMH
jgi:hypothetical protein